MTTHDDEIIRILAEISDTLAEIANILRKIERAIPNPLDRR
jgi:hypothetical protein